MKIVAFIILATCLSACSDKNAGKIESAIKSNEASKGHTIKSYKITSEKDSLHWHIVNYRAIVEGNDTTSGHLVFGVTGDGVYTRLNSINE